MARALHNLHFLGIALLLTIGQKTCVLLSIAWRLAEEDVRIEEGCLETRADVSQRNPSANVHKARHFC